MQFFKYLFKLTITWLYKKNIVVFLGSKEIFVGAFVKDALKESITISLEEKENIDLYKNFCSKFKNFQVFFLLDGVECKMRHDLIPVLQSLVKANPVEKFISEYFNKDDIVAYDIYDITRSPNEIWNTLIASSLYTLPLSTLLEYTIENKYLKFGGSYFLDLEFKPIIEEITVAIHQENLNSYFQIFISILKTSGIKLVVKHKNNIISIQTFDYPQDKSESYIQGIIEQEINECLLVSKSYINNLNLEVCIIIFAVEQNLQVLLQQSKFENHKIFFISAKEVLNSPEIINETFSDSVLARLFLRKKSFLAFNQNLKSIEKLNFIKSLIFKPLLMSIIILVAAAFIIKYKSFQNHREILDLNTKYYSTAQEYNKIKHKYPYIQNTTSLVDLYVLEKLLKAPTPDPFPLLEKLITQLNPSFNLDKIIWQIIDVDHLLLISEPHVMINVFLTFTYNGSSIEQAVEVLNEKIEKLRATSQDTDIDLTIFSDKIIEVLGKVIIPLSITITNKAV